MGTTSATSSWLCLGNAKLQTLLPDQAEKKMSVCRERFQVPSDHFRVDLREKSTSTGRYRHGFNTAYKFRSLVDSEYISGHGNPRIANPLRKINPISACSYYGWIPYLYSGVSTLYKSSSVVQCRTRHQARLLDLL